MATAKTKTELYNEISSNLADNTTGAITASKLREVVQDITASFQDIEKYISDDIGSVLTTDQFNSMIVCNSAGNVSFTLPASTEITADMLGSKLIFVKLGAGNLTINTGAGMVIADSSSGGSIANTDPLQTYATITFRLASVTKWVLTGGDGAWTTA